MMSPLSFPFFLLSFLPAFLHSTVTGPLWFMSGVLIDTRAVRHASDSYEVYSLVDEISKQIKD